MTPIFDYGNPPLRAGFFSIVKATAEAVVSGGTGKVVAIPITHDWGPEGVVREVTTSQEFTDLYGPTKNDNSHAVLGALEGDGTPQGGARMVLVYRMAPTTPNNDSSLALSNGTVTGITLNAKYNGTFGNSLRATVRAHPVLAATDELRITDANSGSLLEAFSYDEADLASLVAKVAEKGKYIAATLGTDGTALTSVTNVALTGGTNAAIVAGDFSDAMDALETETFDLFCMPNMTDATILASARAWVQNMNDNVHHVFFYEGGAAGEDISNANTRSALSMANENIANMGVSVFVDQETDIEYSSAQMIGHTAGIAAGYGVNRSMTYGRYPARFRLKSRPTGGIIDTAIVGGTLICSQDRRGVYIEKGLTTFTADYIDDKPVDIFSRILNVMVIHQIDNDLTDLSRENFIGGVKNTATNRATYIAEVGEYFNILETNTVLDAGSSNVHFDETKDNEGEVLNIIWSSSVTKSIEQILAIGLIQ